MATQQDAGRVHRGSNASTAWLEELAGYELLVGDRSQLYGYPEFSVARILPRLEESAMAFEPPPIAQLITFRAPER